MALVRYAQLAGQAQADDRSAHRGLHRQAARSSSTSSPKASATIAAAFYPKDVIVRLSDFKTNEYARLVGGAGSSRTEENPMIGFRGASRYYDDALPRRLRARVPRAQAGARRDGPDQRQDHGARSAGRSRRRDVVLASSRGNGLDAATNGPRALHDGRDPEQRHSAAGVRRIFRRLLDRLERPDAAHARRRSRLRDRRARLRRAQRGRADAHRAGDRSTRGGSAERSACAARRRATIRSSPRFLVECGIDSMSLNPDAVLRNISVSVMRLVAASAAAAERAVEVMLIWS